MEICGRSGKNKPVWRRGVMSPEVTELGFIIIEKKVFAVRENYLPELIETFLFSPFKNTTL